MRSQELHDQHMAALDLFGVIPNLEEDGAQRDLTAEEKVLYAALQKRAYAETHGTGYIRLRWDRADACMQQRDCALVYDPEKRRYLFLAYVLAKQSRYRRKLNVTGELFDVNNPTVQLPKGDKLSGAMLFELEFARHQVLDQACEDTHR